MTQKEFDAFETDILKRLRAIQERKQGGALGPIEFARGDRSRCHPGWHRTGSPPRDSIGPSAPPCLRSWIARRRFRMSVSKRRTPSGSSHQLEPHLGLEQMLAQGGVVVELLLDRGRDLVQDDRIPPISSLSTMSIGRVYFGPLQLEPDVDEVVRRPGPGV